MTCTSVRRTPLDVTIITGMSGAGRSEAAHVLEDLGFFVIDNLPPMLIGKVAELARGSETPDPLRARRRRALAATSSTTSPPRSTSCAATASRTRILFLDASDEVLVRRYEASRRRHPLSDTDRVSDGIARERALLEPLKGEADLLVDTSTLNVHELRDRLRELFSEHAIDGDAAGERRVVRLQARAARSTSTSCSTAASSRTRTGSTSCGRSPASTRRSATTCSRSGAAASSSTSSTACFGLTLPGYEREGKAYLSIASAAPAAGTAAS